MSLPLIFQRRSTLSGTRCLWVSGQRCNYPTASTTGCETFSLTDIIAPDMLASCRLSPISKPAWYRAWLGPASYVVTAADLYPCTTGNRIFKYADDTYLVVPAANSSTRCQEIEQSGVWAAQNNLKLNSGNFGKTKEMVIGVWGKCRKLDNLPAPCPDIERVSSICILGVTVNDQLSAADHVINLLASSKTKLYALRTLRVHGIPDVSLQEVFHTTLLAKMMYAGPAWHGMCTMGSWPTRNMYFTSS